MMQCAEGGYSRSISDANDRSQHDLAKLARSIGVDPHIAFGFVTILCYDDARIRAKMQEPEHMARRKRRNQ
jgi:hypothetical protein